MVLADRGEHHVPVQGRCGLADRDHPPLQRRAGGRRDHRERGRRGAIGPPLRARLRPPPPHPWWCPPLAA